MFLFCTPWKHQKNQWLSNVFRGYRKGHYKWIKLCRDGQNSKWIFCISMSHPLTNWVFFKSSHPKVFCKKDVLGTGVFLWILIKLLSLRWLLLFLFFGSFFYGSISSETFISGIIVLFYVKGGRYFGRTCSKERCRFDGTCLLNFCYVDVVSQKVSCLLSCQVSFRKKNVNFFRLV